MNTSLFFALLAHVNAAPMMLKILFWVILALCILGIFGWHDNPHFVRGGSVVMLVLIAILGYCTLGF